MSDRVTLTPKAAAHVLGISLPFLYKAMNRGELASLKFGTRRLIHRDDLARFIDAHRHQQHTPVARPVDKAVRRRAPKAAA